MGEKETDVIIAVRRREPPGPAAGLAGVKNPHATLGFNAAEQRENARLGILVHDRIPGTGAARRWMAINGYFIGRGC